MFEDFVPRLHVAQLVILLISIALHESAHAYTAVWCGDPTPALQGRRTLNPLRHLDPLLSVVLPALLIFSGSGLIFGAGKPVRVQPMNMRVPDRDNALVALAGPATNALLVVVFTVLYVLARRQGWVDLYNGPSGQPETWAQFGREWLYFAIWINIVLMVFNLIPIPPLDGSRFLAYLLPSPMKRVFYALDPLGFVILIVLLVTGVLNRILEVTGPMRSWWQDVYTRWI